MNQPVTPRKRGNRFSQNFREMQTFAPSWVADLVLERDEYVLGLILQPTTPGLVFTNIGIHWTVDGRRLHANYDKITKVEGPLCKNDISPGLASIKICVVDGVQHEINLVHEAVACINLLNYLMKEQRLSPLLRLTPNLYGILQEEAEMSHMDVPSLILKVIEEHAGIKNKYGAKPL